MVWLLVQIFYQTTECIMKGEVIQDIYAANDNSEWTLVKTNRSLFSLRLGGFKKENNFVGLEGWTEVSFPYKNRKVEEIYTDEEWVYLLLEESGVIASGWTSIDLLGNMRQGVKFSNIDDYEPGFFESTYFSKLIQGPDGWSKIIPR